MTMPAIDVSSAPPLTLRAGQLLLHTSDLGERGAGSDGAGRFVHVVEEAPGWSAAPPLKPTEVVELQFDDFSQRVLPWAPPTCEAAAALQQQVPADRDALSRVKADLLRLEELEMSTACIKSITLLSQNLEIE